MANIILKVCMKALERCWKCKAVGNVLWIWEEPLEPPEGFMWKGEHVWTWTLGGWKQLI